MSDQTNTIIDIRKLRKRNKKKKRKLSQRQKDLRYIKMMMKRLNKEKSGRKICVGKK